MYLCTRTCDIHGGANTTRELCVRKYLRARATDSWVSPSYIYIYMYVCMYVCMYIRAHVHFYIYGAIKVQVNRGGGLHGSAASKFCGSYVASENAHYPKPKPHEHRFFFFVSFCGEY